MATQRSLAPYASICIIMLVLMGLAEAATHLPAPGPSPHSGKHLLAPAPSHSGKHSLAPAPSHSGQHSPAPAPSHSGQKSSSTSVGAEFFPHFLISLISISLLILAPLGRSF